MRKSRDWIYVATAIVLTIVPFLVAQIPPAVDLPQHLCQIHMMWDLLAGHSIGNYELSLLAPNNMVYLLIAAVDALTPIEWTGRVVMMLLAVAWVFSNFYLARAHARPVLHALLATIFVFNSSLYWGFLNFLIGWPFFAVFAVFSTKEPTWPRSVFKGILALLLLLCHSLWFMMACFYLIAVSAYPYRGMKRFLCSCIPMLPVGLVSLPWVHHLSQVRQSAGFMTEAYWLTSIADRISFAWFTDSMLGGIHGAMEGIAVCAVVFWIALSVITNRHKLRTEVDGSFFAGFAVMMLFGFFAPDNYVSTVSFGRRWIPCAMILLLLALPLPAIKVRSLHWLMIMLCVMFSMETTRVWIAFDKEDLSGLREALHELPSEENVVGLSFRKESFHIKGLPFIQTFAYAQAYNDCNLNFSFAEHMTGVVVAKPGMLNPWTESLEFFPESVVPSDFRYFDYALVNAKNDRHALWSTCPFLHPVTFSGKWRLYEIDHIALKKTLVAMQDRS